MKKILLLLFLIAATMGVTKLSAYCFYNRSKDEKVTIVVYPSKPECFTPKLPIALSQETVNAAGIGKKSIKKTVKKNGTG